LGTELGPWIQIVIAAAIPVIVGLMGWMAAVLNRKIGIENSAALMDAEKKAMDLLQSALTNGAGRVVMLAGNKLDGINIDVKSQYIREAIVQVNKAAQSAVARFGLTDDAIAKMIIDKIGVLTAANPAVTPSTSVNSGASSGAS
jgi:hypothetical protein